MKSITLQNNGVGLQCTTQYDRGDWNSQEWKMTYHQKTGGGVEFAGLENDGLKNDGVEQEQTYILHPKKNFNVYDM